MDKLPSPAALRTFHLAALTLSFRRTAEALGVTPSAVSHQIRALERELGTPLFRRLTRAIELTPEGEFYWSFIRRGFETMAEGTARLRERETDNVLRVSALPFFTSVCLIPRLSAFHKAYPGIELVIETSNRLADFSRDPLDVAIRNLRKPEQGLVSKKLLDIRGEVLCAPEIAGEISGPSGLAEQTLIHVAPRPDAWANWLKAAGVPGLRPAGELWVDTVPAALQAAAEGHGFALGMVPLIWISDLAPRLVRPFEKKVPGDSSYYLVHRPEDAARPKIRAFTAWISGEMKAVSRLRGPPTQSRSFRIKT